MIKSNIKNCLYFFKKHYRSIIIMLLVCVLVFCICDNMVNKILGWKYNISEYEINNFNENKPYFEFLTEITYNIFHDKYENDHNLYCLVFIDFGEEWQISCNYIDSSKDHKETIKKTSEESENLQHVQECFSQAYYTGGEPVSISVHLNRVTFFGYTPYSIIYSCDGEKPEFLISPDENKDIYYQKIAKRWYQCVYKDK